jgi:hypothetical protein
MNCYQHQEQAAIGECTFCQRPVCGPCDREVDSAHLCPDCAREAVKFYRNSKTPAYRSINPSAAAWLGLIPALGAIYNGTYLRALYQFAGFCLIGLFADAADLEALGVLGGLLFYIFTIFDAYRMAKKLQAGVLTGDTLPRPKFQHTELVWGGGLILLGIFFLLHNFDVVNCEIIGKFWPLVLLAGGGYLIWQAWPALKHPPAAPPKSPTSITGGDRS